MSESIGDFTASALGPIDPDGGLWYRALQALPQNEKNAIWEMQNIYSSRDFFSEEVEDLICSTRDMQRECDFRGYTVKLFGKRIILRDVAEKIIVWLSRFKANSVAATGHGPTRTGLLWAAVRFMLRASAQEKDTMGAFLILTERMAYLTYRCSTYEICYSAETVSIETLDRLHDALTKLYTVMLRLIAHACQLFADGNTKGMLHIIFHPQEAALYIQLRKAEQDVEHAAANCNRSHTKEADVQPTNSMLIVKRLVDNMGKLILRADEGVCEALEKVDEGRQLKVLDWVSGTLYEKHHHNVRESRTPSTCEWLLHHKNYREWHESSCSMTLWLHGNSGNGKTHLVSKAIDHIRGNSTSSPGHEGFGFFYCHWNGVNCQGALPILCAFVRQLSTISGHKNSVQKHLLQLYDKKVKAVSTLSEKDCKSLLLKFLEIYPKTTLVLDGLDECSLRTRHQLLDIFGYLLERAPRPVKILISSRSDNAIKTKLSEIFSLQIQAKGNHDDIAKFVKSEISKDKRWESMSYDLQEDIVNSLSGGDKGIFQCATLQVQQILAMNLESSIRGRLERIPKDLKNAYDETYERISARPEVEKKIADSALQWVMCSIEPLTTDLLSEVVLLSTNPESLIISEKDIGKGFLLELCQGLLTYDPDRETWSLPHLSVSEYLEEHHWCKEHANAQIAKACITLLSNTTFNGLEDEISHTPRIPSRTPVLSNGFFSARTVGYAARYWPIHVQNHCDNDVDTQLSALLEKFLGSPTEGSSHYRNWHETMKNLSPFIKRKGKHFKHREVLFNNLPELPHSLGKQHVWFEWDAGVLSQVFRSLNPDTVPSSAVAYYGFNNILHNWWENNMIRLPSEYPARLSLLSLAVIGPPSEGQLEVIQKLLKQGADPNTNIQYAYAAGRNLLGAAVEYEREDIVELLVQHGAHVDMMAAGPYRTALVLAAGTGSAKMTIQLLNLGADIDTSTITYYMSGKHYRNALTAAAAFGHGDIVGLLLNLGADPNLEAGGGRYATPLMAAASHGCTDVIQQLLDAGANIDETADTRSYPTTALIVAAESGKTDAIRLLLQEGADVHTPAGGRGRASALAEAAFYGTAEDIELLLEAGAEVDMICTRYRRGSALIAAVMGSSSNRSLENNTLVALLDAGADVNLAVPDSQYGSALAAAVLTAGTASMYPDGISVIKLLLKAGADIHMELKCGGYKTAYIAAKAVAEKSKGELDWVYNCLKEHERGM